MKCYLRSTKYVYTAAGNLKKNNLYSWCYLKHRQGIPKTFNKPRNVTRLLIKQTRTWSTRDATPRRRFLWMPTYSTRFPTSAGEDIPTSANDFVIDVWIRGKHVSKIFQQVFNLLGCWFLLAYPLFDVWSYIFGTACTNVGSSLPARGCCFGESGWLSGE